MGNACNYCDLIDATPEQLEDMIVDALGIGEDEYSRTVAAAIRDAVAEDIYETADVGAWNEGDVRLAVVRSLANRVLSGK